MPNRDRDPEPGEPRTPVLPRTLLPPRQPTSLSPTPTPALWISLPALAVRPSLPPRNVTAASRKAAASDAVKLAISLRTAPSFSDPLSEPPKPLSPRQRTSLPTPSPRLRLPQSLSDRLLLSNS